MDWTNLAQMVPAVALGIILYKILELVLSKVKSNGNGTGSRDSDPVGQLPIMYWRMEHAKQMSDAMKPLQIKMDEQTKVLRSILAVLKDRAGIEIET